MNSFGRIFRLSILGESHGLCVGIVIDGCPAGLRLTEEDFNYDLRRRQGMNIAFGVTSRKEADWPLFQAGIYSERTTGAPIVILFTNRQMDSRSYAAIRSTPRPGHADWVARHKFGGFADMRGSGHFSGRLTAPIVAAGVIAKKLLGSIQIQASLLEVGGSYNIEQAVKEAIEAQDSLGGLIECRVQGLPAGLGEPFFDSVESLIGHMIFSIPAINGIEFGYGFQSCKSKGSHVNDSLKDINGCTHTNYSGGVNGGISNSNELIFRVSVKPTPSIALPQETIDLDTNQPVILSIDGRHDVCIALRMPVIVEAATAIVLADLMMLEGMIPRIL